MRVPDPSCRETRSATGCVCVAYPETANHGCPVVGHARLAAILMERNAFEAEHDRLRAALERIHDVYEDDQLDAGIALDRILTIADGALGYADRSPSS